MTENPKRVTPNLVGPWWWLGLASRPGSRSLRLRLVIGTWAVWVVLAAIVRLAAPNYGAWSLLMGATLIMMLLWLGRRTYLDTPSLAAGGLDDRLNQVGTDAMSRAYKVFVPVALSAWPLSMVALNAQPNDTGRIDALLIWGAAFLLGTTLPTMIVAWREPDPVSAELPA